MIRRTAGFRLFAKAYSTSGRAGRLEYLLWLAFSAVFFLLALRVLQDAGRRSLGAEALLGEILLLAALGPACAVIVRRIHDADHSATWLIAVGAVWRLVYAIVIWAKISRDLLEKPVGIAACLLLILIGLLKATPGANRYGPGRAAAP